MIKRKDIYALLEEISFRTPDNVSRTKVSRTLEPVQINKFGIFLAGPCQKKFHGEIENGPVKHGNWREKAIRMIREKNFRGIIYSPEFDDGNRPTGWSYKKQVLWESDAMESSDVILFWIPRTEDLPGFTTNVEFGGWMKSKKIVVGAPKDALKMDYIKEKCKKYDVPFFNTLGGCVGECLRRIKKKSSEKTIWFTSDTHFGREITLHRAKRPFNSVEEMDRELIKNWNSVVKPTDEVYHLGDFGRASVLQKLRGRKIYVVLGNHDTKAVKERLEAADGKSGRLRFIEPNRLIVRDGIKLRLVHKPEDAEKSSEDIIYLFGHIHNTQTIKENGINVGTDCHHFFPVSFEGIKYRIEGIKKYFDENVFVDKLGEYSYNPHAVAYKKMCF